MGSKQPLKERTVNADSIKIICPYCPRLKDSKDSKRTVKIIILSCDKLSNTKGLQVKGQ